MPDADTFTEALPAVQYAAPPERARRSWGRLALTVAVLAGELAWLAVCAKVIWVVWG